MKDDRYPQFLSWWSIVTPDMVYGVMKVLRIDQPLERGILFYPPFVLLLN